MGYAVKLQNSGPKPVYSCTTFINKRDGSAGYTVSNALDYKYFVVFKMYSNTISASFTGCTEYVSLYNSVNNGAGNPMYYYVKIGSPISNTVQYSDSTYGYYGAYCYFGGLK